MVDQQDANLERESTLFQYSAALERGDFDTVAAILQQAEGDALLEQMLVEINDVYAQALEPPYSQTGLHTFLEKMRRHGFRPTKTTLAVAAGVIVLAILFLPIWPPPGSEVAGLAYVVTYPISGIEWLVYQARNNQYSHVAQEPPIREPAPQPTLAPPWLPPASLITIQPQGQGLPIPTVAATQAPGTQQPFALPTEERLIIKNGDILILVRDTRVAISQVTQIATDNGGYVLSSQAWSTGESTSAALTIAVRAENFETAMRRLREISLEVLGESSSGQDVSAEYVDLESRLSNLEATRDRVKSFLDEAQTVEEALKVSEQLSQIEGQIEEIKGRMAYLAGRSAFSTITVNIEQKVEATPTPTPTATPLWSLGPTIENATRSQTNLARGLLEAVTWLAIVPGPYFAAGGLILWGVLAIKRRRKGSASPPRSAPPTEES